MRSLIARLAIVGTFGAALAGCGTTNGSSLPVGAPLNGTAGGPVPVSNQGPPPGTIKSVLIDGGVLTSGKYLGFTTTATDSQSAADAGADPKGPANPPGSHSIAFAGNGAINQSFIFTGATPALVPAPATPGQIQPITYGSIVLYTSFAAGSIAVPTPSISIELIGGANNTQYDVRVTCANNGKLVNGFLRQVCDLPAYGSPSGTYTTSYSSTTMQFSAGSAGSTIVNPVVTNAAGTFTPLTGPRFYVLTNSAFLPTTSTGNVLGIDFAYAQQGTQ